MNKSGWDEDVNNDTEEESVSSSPALTMNLFFLRIMSTMYFAVQMTLGISIASGIIAPRDLDDMLNLLAESYFNESCISIISDDDYRASIRTPVVYVVPFNGDEFGRIIRNSSVDNDEEIYKRSILAPVLELGCSGCVLNEKKRKKKPKFYLVPYFRVIIQVENPAEQLRLIDKTFVHINRRIQRKFIFVPTVSRVGENRIGIQSHILNTKNFNFRSILKEKSIQFIPDVIFIIPNHELHSLDIFTHRFSGPDHDSRQEVLLNTYNITEKKFDLESDLFPDKVKDLGGKILKIATFNYPPYAVVYEKNDTGIPTKNYGGTEWHFVVEFARLHNCSLEGVDTSDGLWGTIEDNFTGDGVIGNVLMDEADIGLGALYTWYHEYHYLDLTASTYRSGITCLVPRPDQLPEWMSPVRPFAPTSWACFAVMTLVSVIFVGLVNRAEWHIRLEKSETIVKDEEEVKPKKKMIMTFSDVFMTVAGISLLQGLNKDPKGSSLAALFIILLVVALLIATAYGSSLASAITVPRFEKPIDSAWDLALSGIPWAAPHDAWIFSILEADDPEMRILVENFKTLSPEKLLWNSMHSPSNWAFSIERLQGGHYSIQDYLSSGAVGKMHLMRTDIYWEYCVAMLRKNSPFTEWLSKRILEIQASGIPQYWETDVVLKYLDTRTQLAVSGGNHGNSGPVRMSANQVQGTFFILLIGLLLSFLVFLYEIFTGKPKILYAEKNFSGGKSISLRRTK
ncbi:uncharacterized protein LOC105689287 [Athalia rosae]|uniref:uncharacterized protein LOC105689287 n=1 Tax=Athalia rosae TaxID=37344 RepID=UPI00203331A3|nr:uncharacterized protein LOC105689287 [Athalia rosae]